MEMDAREKGSIINNTNNYLNVHSCGEETVQSVGSSTTVVIIELDTWEV